MLLVYPTTLLYTVTVTNHKSRTDRAHFFPVELLRAETHDASTYLFNESFRRSHAELPAQGAVPRDAGNDLRVGLRLRLLFRLLWGLLALCGPTVSVLNKCVKHLTTTTAPTTATQQQQLQKTPTKLVLKTVQLITNNSCDNNVSYKLTRLTVTEHNIT